MYDDSLVSSRANCATPIQVLMADPDPSLPAVYREPLLREGFELIMASSGLECVAQLRAGVPDVLVLEPCLQWGGGDGVLAIMGDSPELAILPVMILTSCRNPRVLKGIARFPICDYHAKPLAPNGLGERLRSLLGHPQLRFTLNDPKSRLECAIVRRTGGRVCDLVVEVSDRRVIVRGCTESHHVKQLALAAVLEAIETSDLCSLRVDPEIEVCGDCHSSVPAMCFNSKGKRESLQWNGSDGANR